MRQHIKWSAEVKLPYVLNLDENFNPCKSAIPLEYKKFDFKGGEPHLQIISNGCYATHSKLIITQRFNSVKDIFDIVLANDAARRMGFWNIELILPYFPAARQDRVCNDGEPLTVKLFADMINECGFNKVIILSPHSEVTPALLNNVVVLDELYFVSLAIIRNPNLEWNIVCPDAGAGKRVNKVVKHLSKGSLKVNLIRCEKERDVKDGKLKGFFVQADDLGGLPTLIVDDINCMGGTFIGLGEELRKKNCGKLMLFTSHADCVEGIQNIVENFDHYYTTNSKKDWDAYTYTFQGRFTCFKIVL